MFIYETTQQMSMKLCIGYLYEKMRFEVLTAVKMSILVFLVVTPCGLLYLKIEVVCSSKTLLPTSPHDITTQNIDIDILKGFG